MRWPEFVPKFNQNQTPVSKMKYLYSRGGNTIMSQYSLTHDILSQLCILKTFKVFDIDLNKHLPFWCSIQVEPKAVLETYPFITVRGMWDLP